VPFLALAGVVVAQSQAVNPVVVAGEGDQLSTAESVCVYFTRLGEHLNPFFTPPSQENGGRTAGHAIGTADRLMALTRRVVPQMGGLEFVPPGGGRTASAGNFAKLGLIDQYLFAAMQSAGVEPAPPTTDWEFVRRVYLDMTGKIPTPTQTLAFVNSTSPTKRSDLVETLLASPAWIDKWTMFFGDLYKNVSGNAQIQVYRPSVQAFHDYIASSLASNKPYDQMATELITASGGSSYTDGPISLVVNGVVTGGPTQDVYDQQAANITDAFLGISHLNCLLCHNGAGHLTTLTLWGGKQTRYNAWGMSAFLAKTNTASHPVSTTAVTPRYWSVDDLGKYDYTLNTTTGNRPPRQPVGTTKAITPSYIFNGATPKSGEPYRAAFARMITSDPQFARAAVNYIWAYYFGVGLVDPPDTFDPARLDPDNPPQPSGGINWTLQPSNPRLLNALAQGFIDSKYDLKWLMRQIVNSQAYQLSARYNGQWSDAWNSLYARKLVRRLWGEELHDAIAQSSGILPTYTMDTYGTLQFAMQFPEPVGTPDGSNGHVSMWLDSFLRGNRDDQARSQDGSILQTLNLMNDTFVTSRISPTTPTTGLLAANIKQPDTVLVNTLFLNVLSRYPTPAEMTAALANLSNTATRTTEAQNLLWALYNKVDFIFNY
jgi:hypothetical protein